MLYGTLEVHETKHFHHAPEAGKVLWAAADHHAAATTSEDRQAWQVQVDEGLVNAALVEPDPGFPLPLGNERIPPARQRRPLGDRVVSPGMTDESIAVRQRLALASRVEHWAGYIADDV